MMFLQGAGTKLLARARSQPLNTRLIQFINGAIAIAIGNRLNIIHLLEYPKCGGSWIRNMVQYYYSEKPYHLDRIVTRNTVVHLHRKFNYLYSKPLVILRDPRDMFVSYYFYEKKLASMGIPIAITRYFNFSSDIDERQEFYNYLLSKLKYVTDPYFSYKEFVNSWAGRKNVFYTSYEKFKNNPEEELIKIISYLDTPIDLKKIEESVDYNSFERVTKRKYGVSRNAGEEDDQRFQRKGICGDWINYFNKQSCEILERELGDLLFELGYEDDKNWVNRVR